ncbi:hypothetical protein [Falsirhodobacter sp. alg1]|uniref:hypothetical protein n=1 Tax=Falsirhodobacter sp. alg1 TaxID=1472418 RepID=UPI0005EDE97E|nr:hypothetical protein [Falsirhodobacter sp. alg1]
MPVPLRPLAVVALRTGLVAVAIWAVRRGLQDGRTDQRAEEALDDLSEGLAIHRPSDRRALGDSQTNGAARLRRTFRWNGGGVEIDAALLGRVRIRRL